MTDADITLASAEKALVLGIGGGGDVVGALATAELTRDAIVGGVAWERRPIDPMPGPRSADEIEGAHELAPCVLMASPETQVRGRDVLFAESHMARFLGAQTVLIDPNPGPTAIADGLLAAIERLGCDLAVFVDVGGDVLGRGHEPALASPLCDAVLIAAAAHLQRAGCPVLAGVFGPGCDGELTAAEVAERVAELARAGAVAGARGLTPRVADRLDQAIGEVPTEASAQAVRAFRGEIGPTAIRGGRRPLTLTPAMAMTIYFDAAAAMDAALPLANAVAEADSLEQANEALHAIGVRTELDLERAAAEAG